MVLIVSYEFLLYIFESVNFLNFSHWHGSKADQKFPKPDQNFIDHNRPEKAYFYHLSHSGSYYE
jgi:hypothetical protein